MKSARYCLYTLAVTLLTAGQVVAQQESAKNFEFKQCNEDVLVIRVDPEPLQELVQPDLTLLLEEGKARVAIVVQDCSQYWIDDGKLRLKRVQALVNAVAIPSEGTLEVMGVKRQLTTLEQFPGSTQVRQEQHRNVLSLKQACGRRERDKPQLITFGLKNTSL